MTRTTTITMFYTGVAAVCAGILGLSFYLRSRIPKPEPPLVVNSGRETVRELFPIKEDLKAINQNGTEVKLSDLKGKVWLVAEFFAVCPHCMARNGAELHGIYSEFRNHPDFQIVCITVDPKQDTQDRLAQYSSALNADSRNWWFLNAGDEKATHNYLEKQLGFFGIRERTDPLDIEANGRFAHDLGFLLVNRDFKVVGKWPLADARSEEAMLRDPKGYERLRDELFTRIRTELEKSPAP